MLRQHQRQRPEQQQKTLAKADVLKKKVLLGCTNIATDNLPNVNYLVLLLYYAT